MTICRAQKHTPILFYLHLTAYPDNNVGFEEDKDSNNKDEIAAGDNKSRRHSESTDTLDGTEITQTLGAEEFPTPPAESLQTIETSETLKAEGITSLMPAKGFVGVCKAAALIKVF